MNVLYVTSDQAGAGKTAICAALASDLRSRGRPAAVFKPLRAQDAVGDDPDPGTFAALLGQPVADWPFPQLKSGITPSLDRDITRAYERVADGNDALLVEGAPDIPERVSKRLVRMLGARVLAVAAYRPGLDASRLPRWRAAFGESLLGTVITGHTRYRSREVEAGVLPSLRSEGLSPLGAIPEDRGLGGVSVRQIADHLKGRFVVCEELADRLVEHFMIGGLGLDSGEAYFRLRENKAVIVRGDRPDIQMAALMTPTACMVLTQGIEPIEYVQYEAELEEVPLIVVESDTLATMASLGSLTNGSRLDHPGKLERFAALLREHVDVGAIYAGLGISE